VDYVVGYPRWIWWRTHIVMQPDIYAERFGGHGSDLSDRAAYLVGPESQRSQYTQPASSGYGGRKFGSSDPAHSGLQYRNIDTQNLLKAWAQNLVGHTPACNSNDAHESAAVRARWLSSSVAALLMGCPIVTKGKPGAPNTSDISSAALTNR
jgi:hypothetical protein